MAAAMAFRHDNRTQGDPGDGSGSDAERWAGLMARAQDGSQQDYRRLLEEIAPYLRGVCRRHLGRDEEIEDVVQDILLTVHGIRHTYERRRPFKPWLYTIARRRIADWMRQRARRTRLVGDGDGRMASIDESMSGPADTQPDRAAARAFATREMLHAIEALPPRQREAIVLLHLRELSAEEAARTTSQTAGALKVACHRALRSLQLIFDRSHDND